MERSRSVGSPDQIGVVSDYLIPTTFDFIEQGKIACSPTDQNPMQVWIAVDQAVRLLEGQPLLSGAQGARGAVR